MEIFRHRSHTDPILKNRTPDKYCPTMPAILIEAILVKFSKIWSDSLHRTSWSAIEWVKQPLCLPAPACPLVTSAFRLDIQTSFIFPEHSVTFTGCHQDNIANRTNYCPESQAGYVSVYFSSWYCIFCEKNSFYTSLMVTPLHLRIPELWFLTMVQILSLLISALAAAQPICLRPRFSKKLLTPVIIRM